MRKEREIYSNPTEIFNYFENNEIDKNEILEEIENIIDGDIVALLQEYLENDDRGEVYSFIINDKEIDLSSNKIGLRVNYDIHYYWGCSDLNKIKEDNEMYLEIIEKHSSLFVIGEEYYEREDEI